MVAAARARVGDGVRAAVEGSVGIAAYAAAAPAACSARLERHAPAPVEDRPAGRPIIGWTAIALGVLGLIHIQHGLPRPRGDAGGYDGDARGRRCRRLRRARRSITDLFRSTAIAIPLLALLAFFGVLVVTATPVYQIARRLAAARDKLLGRSRGRPGGTRRT